MCQFLAQMNPDSKKLCFLYSCKRSLSPQAPQRQKEEAAGEREEKEGGRGNCYKFLVVFLLNGFLPPPIHFYSCQTGWGMCAGGEREFVIDLWVE